MQLTGLMGKMHHGKDAFFAAVRDHDPFVVRLAFGDDLKREVAAACGVTPDYINAHKARFRPILQWWGTDFRRAQFGEDYWLKQMATALAAQSPGATVLITDVRFANEAALVRARGGRLVKVVRLNYAPPAGEGHASETELDRVIPDETIAAESLAELQCLAGRWWRHQLLS